MGASSVDEGPRQYQFLKLGNRALLLGHARHRYFEITANAIIWRTAPGLGIQGSLRLDDLTSVELVVRNDAIRCVLQTGGKRSYQLESTTATEARDFVTGILEATRGLEHRETHVVYRRSTEAPVDPPRVATDDGTPPQAEVEPSTPPPPRPGLLRSWSSQKLMTPRSSSSSVPMMDDEHHTALYNRIKERHFELRVTKSDARDRALKEAAVVATECIEANMDALVLRSAVETEGTSIGHDEEKITSRHILPQLDKRLYGILHHAVPRLKYAAQLHTVATTAYDASLLAGWARCGPGKAHLKRGTLHDTATWEKRWADQPLPLTRGAAGTAQQVWLHLDGWCLRAYLEVPIGGLGDFATSTVIARRELEGFPMADMDAESHFEAAAPRAGGEVAPPRPLDRHVAVLKHGNLVVINNGEERRFRCTLGRRCLRLERAVEAGGHMATFGRDDAEALAVVAAEAALRDDCLNNGVPLVFVFDEGLKLRISSLMPAPELASVIVVDPTLPAEAFHVEFAHGKRLGLRAASVAEATAWIAAFVAAAGSPLGHVDLALEADLRNTTVRLSEAPTAPLAIDLVVRRSADFSPLGDDIYTVLLASEDDRTRWLLALDAAILDAKGITRPRHRRSMADNVHLNDDDDKDDSPTNLSLPEPPTETDMRHDDEDEASLAQAVRAAATSDDEASMEDAAAALSRFEAEALRRAASARDAAVDLRRRRAAMQEASYLHKVARCTPTARRKASAVRFTRRHREPRGDAREAKTMASLLARGALLVIQLVDQSQMAFEYFAIDPTGDGGDTAIEERKDLVAEYHRWRRDYSIKTDHATWRAAIHDRLGKQADRWRGALASLDVVLPNASAIVVLRLLDGPEEYARPPKDGDVGIVWSGGVQDGGFDVRFQDRARTSAPVVAAAISWMDTNHILAQRFLRTDASTTDHDDDAPLCYSRVMRVLFQQALIR